MPNITEVPSPLLENGQRTNSSNHTITEVLCNRKTIEIVYKRKINL